MGLYNDVLLIQFLYLVPFAKYAASKIYFCDLDLSGSPKVKYFTFCGKPMWDFSMMFSWYKLSISYRLRNIPHLRFRLVSLTFQGHRKSNISLFWEASMGFHSGLLLIRTVYSIPFARYATSKISVSDLDLSRSPKVKYFYFFKKPICDFIMMFCRYKLYLVPFARYSTSKISVSDLDLSVSPKVKYFNFLESPFRTL